MRRSAQTLNPRAAAIRVFQRAAGLAYRPTSAWCGTGLAERCIIAPGTCSIVQASDDTNSQRLLWVFDDGFGIRKNSANGPITICGSCQEVPVTTIHRLGLDRAKAGLGSPLRSGVEPPKWGQFISLRDRSAAKLDTP